MECSICKKREAKIYYKYMKIYVCEKCFLDLIFKRFLEWNRIYRYIEKDKEYCVKREDKIIMYLIKRFGAKYKICNKSNFSNKTASDLLVESLKSIFRDGKMKIDNKIHILEMFDDDITREFNKIKEIKTKNKEDKLYKILKKLGKKQPHIFIAGWKFIKEVCNL